MHFDRTFERNHDAALARANGATLRGCCLQVEIMAKSGKAAPRAKARTDTVVVTKERAEEAVRTLLRWADNLHRLADALADTFENLFPADALAALSDQLWFTIHDIQQRYTAVVNPPQPCANPWHDWGWYCQVALSDDLVDETSEEQLEACDLKPIIREVLAGLEPREQLVIALRYGFNGAQCSRSEVGRRLGLTSDAVRRIEQRALRRLQHPYRSRRLRDYLN